MRGLQQQVYEFWVTAATASGEGEMSAVVARKPNTRGNCKNLEVYVFSPFSFLISWQCTFLNTFYSFSTFVRLIMSYPNCLSVFLSQRQLRSHPLGDVYWWALGSACFCAAGRRVPLLRIVRGLAVGLRPPSLQIRGTSWTEIYCTYLVSIYG